MRRKEISFFFVRLFLGELRFTLIKGLAVRRGHMVRSSPPRLMSSIMCVAKIICGKYKNQTLTKKKHTHKGFFLSSKRIPKETYLKGKCRRGPYPPCSVWQISPAEFPLWFLSVEMSTGCKVRWGGGISKMY